MRFASLGSGSRGNGTLVSESDTCVLVDCGFSEPETCRRLARLGKTPDDLDAIVVTHEHTDHIKGVARLAEKYSIPVWMSHGTYEQSTDSYTRLHLIHGHDAFEINSLQIKPLTVPHDAREPLQFVFGNGDVRLGILTDTGVSTPHIESMLYGCEALLLECNHDTEMLMKGSYPDFLKQRVGGQQGHLSNEQAAELLKQIDHSCLQHVVAAHLSDKNNTAELACLALSGAIGCAEDWIQVAGQDTGLSWLDISH